MCMPVWLLLYFVAVFLYFHLEFYVVLTLYIEIYFIWNQETDDRARKARIMFQSSQLPRRRHPFSGQSLLLLVRGPTGRLTRLEAAETLIYFTCLSFSLSNSRRLHTFLVTVRSKHGFKSSEMCKTKCVYFLGLNPSDETAGAFGVELSSLVVNASSFIRALFSSNEQGRGNQQKLRVHESYCI